MKTKSYKIFRSYGKTESETILAGEWDNAVEVVKEMMPAHFVRSANNLWINLNNPYDYFLIRGDYLISDAQKDLLPKHPRQAIRRRAS